VVEARTDTSCANPDLGDTPIPPIVSEIAAGRPITLLWRNEVGGLTFRAGDKVIKWNPHSNVIDLSRERDRLRWLAARHPAPTVLGFGSDTTAQWLVTEALDGEHAIGPRWRVRPSEAIHAIAAGLRAILAVPTHDFPEDWTSWANEQPPDLAPRPAIDGPVLVHGDACAPNTLINTEGEWVGHVDVGALAIGDRWADLAIASMSLDWNFEEGHQAAFFAAYGIEPDAERIAYYRALWSQRS